MAVGIIQTAFIGDVVLTTPLFEAARVSMPGEKIIAVVRAGCDNIIENNPNIDEILVWDKHGSGKGPSNMTEIAGLLREKNADILLIPHRSFRSGCAAFFSGAPTRIGFNRGGGALLHTKRVRYPTDIHEVERNLELARAAGWKHEGFSPSIFPDSSDIEKVNQTLGDVSSYCVLAPGSVWDTKRWPPEYYIEAGRIFLENGYIPVLSGGPSDAEICREIADEIDSCIDSSGLLTLRQSAELYRGAKFILTGDTAPQHIAAAMGIHVFALFGPTVCEFGFWPYTKSGMVIERELACRPCGIHGHKQCKERTHKCLRSLSGKWVASLIFDRIEAVGNKSGS